jgi:hypothetical protein
MRPEQHHALYRWTEYTREQQRAAYERRHALAAVLGALLATVCFALLVYLYG